MRRLFGAVVLVAVMACGGSNNPTSAQFQPEIVNNPDSFAFQVTAVQNGSATLAYTWQNSGAQASINQSSAISAGTVTLVVKDAAGAQVYSGTLAQDGTFTTNPGVPGAWTIHVEFASATGTMNFRAQKL
jgi:hypothetical protein